MNSFTNWYSLAFNGVIALFYGILAIFVPQGTLLTIITYFGVVILIVGVAMLIGVINNIKSQEPYVVDLIWTIITIFIGALLTFYTKRSIEIFVIIIAVWAILMGAIQLYIMSKINSEDRARQTFMINGILTLLFGITLFFNPFTAASAVLFLTGVVAFFIGVLMIVLAIRLKGLTKQMES